jgi:hypothetical protein
MGCNLVSRYDTAEPGNTGAFPLLKAPEVMICIRNPSDL